MPGGDGLSSPIRGRPQHAAPQGVSQGSRVYGPGLGATGLDSEVLEHRAEETGWVTCDKGWMVSGPVLAVTRWGEMDARSTGLLGRV